MRLALALIHAVSCIVPLKLRADWCQEWEAEIRHRFLTLKGGHRVSPVHEVALLVRCLGALPDALWLCRYEWSADMLIHDLRQSLRTMTARPAFTAGVVFILALGIGANTAVFSVVHSVLLRSLPFPDPDQLVMIWDVSPDLERQKDGPSPGNVLDWRTMNRVFDGIGAWYASQPMTYRDDTDAEKVQTARVTTDFFGVFQRSPQLGRTFDAGEVEREDSVVVLSHALWQRRFGGNADILGRAILLDDKPYRVLGVMPADFEMPSRDVGFWVPWDFRKGYANLPTGVPRDYRFLRVAARLKPGVTIEQAQENMNAISAALEVHTVNKGWRTRLVPLKDEIVGDLGPVLWVLFGAVAFVLLIACTNISNLLLTRAVGRSREMAVRSAIGASRLRIVRQLLTENLILSVAGGVAGLLCAYLGLETLLAMAPENLPRLDGVSIDFNVLAFTAGISIVTALLFGFIPSVYASRGDLSGSLREGSTGTGTGRAHKRFGSAMVVFEIGAAFTLLTGAGLLLQSFINIIRMPPGFNPDNVLVMRVFPDARKYRTTEQRLNYFGSLQDNLRSLPGVVSVGATTGLPMNPYNNAPSRPYWRQDRPVPAGGAPEGQISMVTVGYFQTMSTRLLEGRDFDSRDHVKSEAVVIVNESLSRKLWGPESPVGRHLVIDYATRGTYPYLVVGVVEDTRSEGLRLAPSPEMFLPHAQVAYATMNVVVRTTGDPLQLTNAVRREVLNLDPTQPVYSITTMNDLLATTLARDRFSAVLLSVLAGLAVLLAASGIFSVMAFFVSRRTREIGLRIALGAGSGDVRRLVLSHGAAIVLGGVAVGLACSVALTRTMSALLFEVSATEPVIFVGVVLLLGIVAFFASYVPLRRAIRVSPIEALRD